MKRFVRAVFALLCAVATTHAAGAPLLAAPDLPPDTQVLASDVAKPVPATAPAPDADPVDPVVASFQSWMAGYAAAAPARGLDAATVANIATTVRYSARAIELDRAQPDDSARKPSVFADYIDRRLEPVRIGRGRAVKADMAAKLAEIEAASGVPTDIVLGIWGMESSYGSVTGGFDVPSAVASLAFDGRRRDLFTRELDAAVAIIASGRATRAQLRGSWAGAMGQPQFLPSSYLAYAADGDGDGRADIWDTPADVAASIANYLMLHGWQRGAGWGFPVVVPASFDRTSVAATEVPTECVRPLQRHSRWVPVSEWRARGLIVANGKPWPEAATLASLVEPDGAGGRAYLTFANYRVILTYNCSNYYALSVALLGDALD